MLSSRWATLDVPGIGNMTGERLSSHARASCDGVASCWAARSLSGPPSLTRLPVASGNHGMKPMPFSVL